MANAHPEVLARARAIAPPNTEGGVVTVLAQLIAADALTRMHEH
jgi:hydroxymethylpyrimidine pyrophosphatase-like HAD family hydrolase